MATLFESSLELSSGPNALQRLALQDEDNYVVVEYDDLIESHHQALLDEYDIVATLSEAEANWS